MILIALDAILKQTAMLSEKALAMQEVGHFQQGLVGVDTCASSVACFLEDFADVNIELQLWIASRQLNF